jgi:pSer/pThr/pTyr-binding forkhead associated (FHA) protein
MNDPQGTPCLVIVIPEADRGRRIPLRRDYSVVGREPSCDVRFDDPCVSRTHAALEQHGGAVFVQDLASSTGTTVNGAAVSAARELRPGDLVAFAGVIARFEAGVSDDTVAAPPPPAGLSPATQPAPSTVPRYDIGAQRGELISNVGREQYSSYVRHVIQQRENFLREIAAARTRARRLIWIGFLAFVAGFAIFAATDLSLLKQISNDISSGRTDMPQNPFGPGIAGVPAGLLGWAIGALGSLILIVGIVMYIVATARRRRVERELAVPSPWQVPAR